MLKYRNKPTTVDNIRFASQKEANRYCELKLLLAAGEIRDLEVHPVFPLVVNGQRVCTYIADFRYHKKGTYGKAVVEDVKSKATRTAAYMIKKKLLKAVMAIDVTEV